VHYDGKWNKIQIYVLYNFLTEKQALQKIYAQGNNEVHPNICVLICQHIFHFPKSNDLTYPFWKEMFL
jgi:hypothetical protein